MGATVVIVALAPPEALSDAGLTVQTGKYGLVIGTTGVTVQLRVTGPLMVPPCTAGATVMLIEETSPGTTASGFKGSVVRVKSVAARAGNAPANSKRQSRGRATCADQNFHGDLDGLDFNMSGLSVQVRSIPGTAKTLPVRAEVLRSFYRKTAAAGHRPHHLANDWRGIIHTTIAFSLGMRKPCECVACGYGLHPEAVRGVRRSLAEKAGSRCSAALARRTDNTQEKAAFRVESGLAIE